MTTTQSEASTTTCRNAELFARAQAALDGQASVEPMHLRKVAAPALRHRLRRNPLDNADAGTRVERAVTELLGD